jgi:hypothetical protein
MAGTHHERPGEKTRQSDKKLEEHESVLDSPEHIVGVAKSKSKHPQQKTSGEACDSALSGPECIEPEKQKRPSRSKG